MVKSPAMISSALARNGCEGGTRAAACIAWKGHIPAGSTVNQPVHIVDVPDAAPPDRQEARSAAAARWQGCLVDDRARRAVAARGDSDQRFANERRDPNGRLEAGR